MLEIKGYEILEKIADGGMATVWKARQLSLDRLVALKVLGVSSLPDQEARDHFRKEARLAARLNHPNIVQVYDTGESEGAAYLVMEYVEGSTVGDLIRRTGPLPEARALDIATQVAKALAYAWEKECLIHCDIKPDNMLVDRASGTVKVTDLGISRLIGLLQSGPDNDAIIGTPNYTAPEVSAGLTDLDCRTDLYSLGASLYHMVTGVMPFRDAPGSSAMARHETDFLDDPMTVNASVSAPVAWLLEKWMMKDRALRPHFWSLALKDLEEVSHGRMPPGPLPEAGKSTIRRSADRTVVKTNRSKVMLAPGPEGPRKLTIKKPDTPPPAAPPPRESVLARVFGTLVSLSITAAALYAVAWYHGVVPDPRTYLTREKPVTGTEVAPEADTAPAAGQVTAPATTERPGKAFGWHNEDFLAGAKAFNQALADYTEFQKTRRNPEILKRVEERCRQAIASFEACLDLAPSHINVREYIDQCYGLIADVHHSTQLDVGLGDDAPSSETAPEPMKSTSRDDLIVIEDAGTAPGPGTIPPPSTKRSSGIVFIDDGATVEEKPATNAAAGVALRLVALDDGWEEPGPGSFEFANDLSRLLSRHAQPTNALEVDASAVLYPGVVCMATARETAKNLKVELPIRRPLRAPGLPANGLFYYTLTGDFSGAAELSLVVDMNDRVVMIQLNDDRLVPARMEAALFSPNWKAYDFIHARKRADTDGLIAHRVRRRDNVLRIETELAASTAPADRQVKARVILVMPVQMAGILLHTASAGP